MTDMASPGAVLLRSRLGRHMLGWLVAVLTVCSLLFLSIFVTAYRARLLDEHARASMQVNKLLEASLKNAMLKRDIPGLRAIIGELGAQSDIAAVYILNPEGEVRFSTDSAREGQPFPGTFDAAGPESRLVAAPPSGEVLRTVNPVRNEERCQACHGATADNPVNGILVVDYAAGGIRQGALRGAVLMTLAGGAVLLAALAAIALLLQRRVLRPLRHLNEAANRFAGGELGSRVEPVSNDEVADLGHRFNSMAGSIGQMVQTLQINEEFLQRVIDAMPDGVRVIGDDYRILKVNAAYCRQLGIAPEEALGQLCHASTHHLEAPCSPRLVTCPLEELKAGRSALKCRHRHLRADGGELFVEVSAARATLDHGGRPVNCIIESIRDQAEQAEASHQHRLSEIGQIAAGVAHEIHNPLSSIHLALTAIQVDTRATGAADRVSDYIDIANREINRCLDVTGRLLRISEPVSAEKALLRVEPVLRDVVALVSYQARQSAVAVRLEIAGDPRIIANEGDLAIVALNIVQNAIHAMPQGGTLTVRAAASSGQVTLGFADTGVGIAAEDLQRIFWPFWSRRADGSQGSGLGLSICRAAVSRMDGSLRVASAPGRGTTVVVDLPDADRVEAVA